MRNARGACPYPADHLVPLVTMRNDANQNGYRLEMVAPEENVTRIFRVTGTHSLFHWRD